MRYKLGLGIKQIFVPLKAMVGVRRFRARALFAQHQTISPEEVLEAIPANGKAILKVLLT